MKSGLRNLVFQAQQRRHELLVTQKRVSLGGKSLNYLTSKKPELSPINGIWLPMHSIKFKLIAFIGVLKVYWIALELFCMFAFIKLQGRKMLVLATTSAREALEEQQLTRAFSWHLHVGMMSTPTHIMAALEEDQRLTPQECRAIEQNLLQRKCVTFQAVILILVLSSSVLKAPIFVLSSFSIVVFSREPISSKISPATTK